LTALQERLAEELAKKVERHGVVVWDDPEAAFSTVVDKVTPAGVTLHRFDGSWFDLRHRLEKSPSAAISTGLIAGSHESELAALEDDIEVHFQ